MTGINTAIMTGRLARDPVLKNNGTLMGYFTLASNDRYRD
jgi:single-stranded DNA-binding protein